MLPMKPGVTAILALFLLLPPFGGARSQESSPGTPPGITHLLSHIERSGCTFIRNGVGYDGHIAAAFMQRKYERLRASIQDAQDFISIVATRSETSGEPYRVRCPGRQPIASADWLSSELRAFLTRADAD